jgi:hypothetical protein
MSWNIDQLVHPFVESTGISSSFVSGKDNFWGLIRWTFLRVRRSKRGIKNLQVKIKLHLVRSRNRKKSLTGSKNKVVTLPTMEMSHLRKEMTKLNKKFSKILRGILTLLGLCKGRIRESKRR